MRREYQLPKDLAPTVHRDSAGRPFYEGALSVNQLGGKGVVTFHLLIRPDYV